MLKGRYMAGLACVCAVSTVMTSTVYAATTTYDMRKKAVSLIGIMKEVNRHQTVTRQEFARMLVNASEYANVTGTTSNVSVYADVSKDSEYASAIRTAVTNEWMTGYLGGFFKPEQGVTMREAARALLMMLGYTNSDFTGNINENRMKKFSELALDLNIYCEQDEVLTREDCIHLFYNLMKAKTKSGSQYGSKVFSLKYGSDGEINMSSILDNSMKGPKIIDESLDSLNSLVPFSTKNANFFLDGQACDEMDICSSAMLIYYHESTKTVFGYSQYGENKGVSHGEIQAIYYDTNDPFAPVTVELDSYDQDNEEGGDIFNINASEIQFLFSMYGEFEVGDEIYLVWEKNGNNYTAIDVVGDY